MNEELYLLWSTQGWGVFDSVTCPDTGGPGGIPNWCYMKYEVPKEQSKAVFRRLLDVRADLVERSVVPTKERYKEIFPELSDLME